MIFIIERRRALHMYVCFAARIMPENIDSYPVCESMLGGWRGRFDKLKWWTGNGKMNSNSNFAIMQIKYAFTVLFLFTETTMAIAYTQTHTHTSHTLSLLNLYSSANATNCSDDNNSIDQNAESTFSYSNDCPDICTTYICICVKCPLTEAVQTIWTRIIFDFEYFREQFTFNADYSE